MEYGDADGFQLLSVLSFSSLVFEVPNIRWELGPPHSPAQLQRANIVCPILGRIPLSFIIYNVASVEEG